MFSYIKKGGIAVIDQILFSGSNFLLNIFLAKILLPKDYGLFGSLYAMYMLIFIAYAAVFLEPYLFYKNVLKDNNRYTFLYVGFSNNVVILSTILMIVSLIVKEYILMYLAFTLSTCVIYFYKRHYFSILDPIKSLFISISYFVFIVIGLFILNNIISKNLSNSFLILNISSLCSILIVFILNKDFRHILYKNKSLIEFVELMKQQKKFSVSCLNSSILGWVPNNIYFIILPIIYSPEVNANFKALQNINLPLYHFNIAIVSLLIPVFIKNSNSQKIINTVSKIFTLITMFYIVIIIILLNDIETLVYNNKYLLDPLLVLVFILSLLPEILSNIYKAYFRSIEKPNLVVKINLRNCIVSFICVLSIVYNFGLKGVIFSNAVVGMFNLLNTIYIYRNINKEVKLYNL